MSKELPSRSEEPGRKVIIVSPKIAVRVDREAWRRAQEEMRELGMSGLNFPGSLMNR